MKAKVYISLFAYILVCLPSFAQVVSPETALHVAKTFLLNRNIESSMQKQSAVQMQSTTQTNSKVRAIGRKTQPAMYAVSQDGN